ncbi:MAG: hypothetical protein IPN71_08535 [Fibrobacteres bacterium]|nr:hypothetical protein [Fibrobacterota bacterium]
MPQIFPRNGLEPVVEHKQAVDFKPFLGAKCEVEVSVEYDPNRMLKVREVANLFGISIASVYRGMAKGLIPEPKHPTPGGFASRWVYSELLKAMDKFRCGRKHPETKAA